MNYWRLGLAVLVVTTAIVGTYGFTTVQSERNADVSVAEDPDAYLAVDYGGDAADGEPVTIANGTSGTVLVVTNNLGQTVDLTLLSASSGPAVNNVRLGSSGRNVIDGESVDVVADTECDSSTQTYVELRLRAESSDDEAVSIELSRSITVTCQVSS